MDAAEHIDATIAGWSARFPDLDVGAMRTFLLLARASAHLGRRIEEGFGSAGLTSGEFDVLASLFHAEGERAKPTDLARYGMVSPAGMTNRLDRLEQSGLVTREIDPDDRRSLLVRLTAAGRRTVSSAVDAHVRLEAELLAPLSPTQRKHLDAALRTLLAAQDGDRR